MATSASTLNHEEEVPSIVEGEGTPLAAGSEGAAVEVVATDFQSFLKSQPRLQIRIASNVTQANIDEHLILEIDARGVKSIANFVCLKGTEAEMRNTLASAFGMDGTTVEYKAAIGRALKGWQLASYRASVYEAVAAQCKDFGRPVKLQDSEYHPYIGSLARSLGALTTPQPFSTRRFMLETAAVRRAAVHFRETSPDDVRTVRLTYRLLH